MKLEFPCSFQRSWFAVLPLLMTGWCLHAQGVDVVEIGDGPELKFEVQLIWGTNDKNSPNPKHKPVEPEIRKKLDEIPLKWANYFEVTRKQITVPKGGKAREPLSEKCSIEVKDIEGRKIELKLFDKHGKAVIEHKQPLPKGELLLVSGNAPDKTAWFIAVKRIK